METPCWCPSEGAQTWPPEIDENIWNSLLFFQRFLFSRELLYNHINFSPNALTVQTAKNHKDSPFLAEEKALSGTLCWCHVG